MENIRSYFHTPTYEEMSSSIYITWAGHRACSSEHSIGPRVMDNYKLVYVVKGHGIFRQNDKEYYISSGEMFALFPGVKHFYRADLKDPWEFLWVSFNGNICKSVMDSFNLTPHSPVIKCSQDIAIVQLMNNIIDELEDDIVPYALKATGFLYELFSELILFTQKINMNPVIKVKEESIRKAMTLIELNYYNDIDVDVLCKHVNFSRSHFSRLFRKETGMSIPEYINKVRIQRAKALMHNTDLNIQEISKSVGFDDPFYFSRLFKKLEGHSPSVFKMMPFH